MDSVTTSVAKTALDALNAKVSAVEFGYQPVPVKQRGDLYVDFLYKMKLGVSISRDPNQSQSQSTLQPAESQSQRQSQRQSKNQNQNRSYIKRQSPLVNAGYALRVASLSKMIFEFIDCRCREEPQPQTQGQRQGLPRAQEVNIVILGCGLDVLGLWCATYDNVNVYEIDCFDNCVLKRHALMSSNLVLPTACSSRVGEGGVEGEGEGRGLGYDETADDEKNKDILLEGVLNWNISVEEKKTVEEIQMPRDSDTTKEFKNFGRTTCTSSSIQKQKQKQKQKHKHNYTLMSADLRCVSSLQNALSASSSFDASKPTMVVSELVLAYLGTQSVCELLSFLSSQICQQNDASLFVAYEPVSNSNSTTRMDGTSNNNNHNNNHNGVVRAYTKDYFGQFSTKINKGNAIKKEERQKSKSACTSTSTSTSTSSNFEPIGRSSLHTIDFLRSCGFDGFVDCKKIISAAKKLNLSHINLSPELFDEHAALHLHMHCYSVVGAQAVCPMSSSQSQSRAKKNMFVNVCPWSNVVDASCGMGRLYEQRMNPNSFSSSSSSSSSDNIITIASVKNEHQEQVRILFGNTYGHLFDKYPSVKKMVKNALKTDLSSTRIVEKNDDENDNYNDNRFKSDYCAIWDYYSRRGGSFWVVIDNAKGDRIIGCIGITRLKVKLKKGDDDDDDDDDDGDDDSDTNAVASRSYEIHRLAVHPDYRGKGIGRLLLQTVEEFVHLIEYDDTTALYATTPEIMEAANSLYTAQSYQDIDNKQLGNMNIKTYRKILIHTNTENDK